MYVVAPALTAINIFLFLLVVLWKRDGTLPVWDVGFICALATLVYTVMPLFSFVVGGLEYSPLSDNRLYVYDPTPFELGSFHWRHVLYLFFFVTVYIVNRGTISILPVNMPDRNTCKTILHLFLLFAGYFVILELFTDYNPGASYKEMRLAYETGIRVELPLFLKQITNYFGMWQFVFELALLMIVVQHCYYKKWRLILYIWLFVKLSLSLLNMGGRTKMVLFLMATAILYHRLIKPLKIKFIMPAGLLLLVVFLGYGVVRDMNPDKISMNNDFFSAATGNEFQAALGTCYDIHQQMETRPFDVPPQLYISELLSLIPSQICPIEKVDPSEWYLGLLGVQGTGVGFTFGVISQAVLGLDWLELALRGALLGFILAKVHNWYGRNSSSFFATLFYLWISVFIYYTFRVTTFSLGPVILYGLLPAFLIIRALSALFARHTASQAVK